MKQPLVLVGRRLFFGACFVAAVFFAQPNSNAVDSGGTSFRTPKKVGLRQLLGVVKSFANNANLSEKLRLHSLWDRGSSSVAVAAGKIEHNNCSGQTNMAAM
jgi:hypothetical protein